MNNEYHLADLALFTEAIELALEILRNKYLRKGQYNLNLLLYYSLFLYHGQVLIILNIVDTKDFC